MRFQIPQFIEVEDKIFGPLTIKQFVYLAGGGAAIFLLYVALPFFLFILLSIPVGAFAGALAFYKINNQPFIKVVENAFRYFTKTKVYIWKKKKEQTKQAEKEKKTQQTLPGAPTLTKERLSDLAWSLDIKRGEQK